MKQQNSNPITERIVEIVALHGCIALGELAAILHLRRGSLRDILRELPNVRVDEYEIVWFTGDTKELGGE